MSDHIQIALIAIGILLVITGIVTAFLWKKKKEEKPAEIDYRVFFILGICWFPLGVVFVASRFPIGYVFFILGFLYLVIGLANRDKWKKE